MPTLSMFYGIIVTMYKERAASIIFHTYTLAFQVKKLPLRLMEPLLRVISLRVK